ncbi:MAG: crossover junction endodeoxyribonuclease RuvC [Bdellovibrionota bacterium]
MKASPRGEPLQPPLLRALPGGEKLFLGIDPGTIALGWGIVGVRNGPGEPGKVFRHHASGVLRTMGELPLEVRLAFLYEKLREVIRKHGPTEAAVEEPFIRMAFGKTNPKSALTLAKAAGVSLAACFSLGLPVAGVYPSQAKKAAAGNGSAEKHEVAAGIQEKLGLERRPPLDAADALAIALAAAGETK